MLWEWDYCKKKGMPEDLDFRKIFENLKLFGFLALVMHSE